MDPDRTKPSSLAAEIVIVASALVLILIAQWMLSGAIRGTNYHGYDGKMMRSVVLAAFEFGGVFEVTNLNPLQGIGSQLLPKNVWANPSFWPFAFFSHETAANLSALIAFACFAGAIYIMMRCFDVPVLPSALAAQSSIALFAPTLLLVHTPTSFAHTPADAVAYAPYMIALGLIGRLEPGRGGRSRLSRPARAPSCLQHLLRSAVDHDRRARLGGAVRDRDARPAAGRRSCCGLPRSAAASRCC